jgi:ABC-type Mn2+/Zn2+ transport system permease subunit
MIDFFADAFASDLTRRALLGGLLAAVTMALVGSWVVVRGLSFAGDALAHGVIPGIALAVLWGFSMTLGAFVSAAVMMGGVSAARRTGRIGEDASIGLLFAGMLALGVVIISREDTYAGDLTALLFGDILAVQPGDLLVQAAVASGTLVAIALLYRRLLVLSFDPRKAAVLGQQPGFTHAALLGLLAVAIVASFQVVGVLLVVGLLVAPAATSLLLVRRMPLVVATSVLVGCASVVLGLAVSYHNETAPSASVAAFAVGLFFVVAAVRSLLSTMWSAMRS